MNLNKEEIKNKILYRATYRGSKEMDILISSFVKSVIDDLKEDELQSLDELINMDDENLLKLNQGLKIDLKIENNKVVNLFKSFKK
tara:strand:+ start:262 stop:519 length:258 start_codon:yes stop_codon:yes gene_type:complete